MGHGCCPLALALHFSRKSEGGLKLEEQGGVGLVQPLYLCLVAARSAHACLQVQVAEEGLEAAAELAALHSPQHELAATIGDGDWAVNTDQAAIVAVMAQHACLLPLTALQVTLSLAQAQAAAACAPSAWLLTTGTPLSHDVLHVGSWGMSRAARVETTQMLLQKPSVWTKA